MIWREPEARAKEHIPPHQPALPDVFPVSSDPMSEAVHEETPEVLVADSLSSAPDPQVTAAQEEGVIHPVRKPNIRTAQTLGSLFHQARKHGGVEAELIAQDVNVPVDTVLAWERDDTMPAQLEVEQFTSSLIKRAGNVCNDRFLEVFDHCLQRIRKEAADALLSQTHTPVEPAKAIRFACGMNSHEMAEILNMPEHEYVTCEAGIGEETFTRQQLQRMFQMAESLNPGWATPETSRVIFDKHSRHRGVTPYAEALGKRVRGGRGEPFAVR